MKVGIYNPYLDTLGGGEKFSLSIAKFFEEKGDTVHIFWDNNLSKEVKDKFSIDLGKVTFKKNIFKEAALTKAIKTREYDIIFFMSDGSLPFLLSKKNYLIFQFLPKLTENSLTNRLKLKKINKVICYSHFIKTTVDKKLGTDSFVLYPPASLNPERTAKENLILSVGRYTTAQNNKKHEVLIDAFKKLKIGNYKLVIAGSVLEQDRDSVKKLRGLSKGSEIEIVESPSYDELIKLYSKAKIYWHATGFGEDLVKNPERAEHFGISTVEAMSAGVVPVVINAGGQKEIVEDNNNGFLWNNIDELIEKTSQLIEDDNLRERFSRSAVIRSGLFSKENFYNQLEDLLL